jgi:tRNA(Ile)-lysidine synthase
MGLDPDLAAVRIALRRVLPGPGEVVLVACSGGADSLALLAACVFEARKVAVRVVGAIVDHGLQAGSAEHTAEVVVQMQSLGVDETATIRVTVDPGPGGIESGAREARYAALGQLAEHFDAKLLLVGHTLDDQAETVLLGLARGSGGRSLQGMRAELALDGVLLVRPLLGLTRAQTEAACRAEGITWWEDPHNADRSFLRSRVRHAVLPVLEAELGPGVAQALARTAAQLRSDMDFIDPYADQALAQRRVGEGAELELELAGIDAETLSVVTRLLRAGAIEAGAIAAELTYGHVLALVGLLGAEAGKQVQLPGHLTASRAGSRLVFARTTGR